MVHNSGNGIEVDDMKGVGMLVLNTVAAMLRRVSGCVEKRRR